MENVLQNRIFNFISPCFCWTFFNLSFVDSNKCRNKINVVDMYVCQKRISNMSLALILLTSIFPMLSFIRSIECIPFAVDSVPTFSQRCAGYLFSSFSTSIFIHEAHFNDFYHLFVVPLLESAALLQLPVDQQMASTVFHISFILVMQWDSMMVG